MRSTKPQFDEAVRELEATVGEAISISIRDLSCCTWVADWKGTLASVDEAEQQVLLEFEGDGEAALGLTEDACHSIAVSNGCGLYLQQGSLEIEIYRLRNPAAR